MTGVGSSTPGNHTGRATLAVVATILAFFAIFLPQAEDYLPFHVASTLVGQGSWDLYPLPQARSLLQVSPAFRQAAESLPARVPEPALTAFLSPPPAAWLALPLRSLPYDVARILWRLALVAPVVWTLGLLTREVERRRPQAAPGGSFLWLAALPLLVYAVILGQPSVLFLPVVAAMVLPPRPWIQGVAGLALALLVLTKATPLLVLPAAWWMGRRLLAGVCGGVLALVLVPSLLWIPPDAWSAFLSSSQRLAASAVTECYNASLEGFLARWVLGSTGDVWLDPGPWSRALANLGRLSLLALAAHAAWRHPPRRPAALWVGFLALTPLLWHHYFLIFLPLLWLGLLHPRWPAPTLRPAGWMALLSLPIAARIAGVPAFPVGALGTVAWVATALLVLLWDLPGGSSRVADPKESGQ